MNEKTKRCYTHDYCSRSIYLVTVSVEGRKPLLGLVEGTAERAWIALSEVGKAVWKEIENIPRHWPQVRVLQHQIMPDHVHLVIFVQEQLPEATPLGNLVAAWKQACGRAYSDLIGASGGIQTGGLNSGGLKAATPNDPHAGELKDGTRGGEKPGGAAGGGLSGEAAFRSPYRPLFDKGFNDSILSSRDQLRHMMDYVRDNPRRLIIKHHSRPFFTLHRGLSVGGATFDAIGNLSLLQKPLVAVHCRRRWSEQEQQAFFLHCMEKAREGWVLIGAFISPQEKAIARAAQEQHLPMICLMENGFADLYKPLGEAFYAMAEGRLLQLVPFPYHNNRQTITREQCNQLNRLAERLAAQGAA